MLIRDHYVNAIYRMASRFGRESGDHVMPRNATLPRCIDYAASYFHEGDTKGTIDTTDMCLRWKVCSSITALIERHRR